MAEKTWKYDEPVLTIELTDEMADDWLRGARLKPQADEGDEAAQAELDRMEKTKLKRVE